MLTRTSTGGLRYVSYPVLDTAEEKVTEITPGERAREFVSFSLYIYICSVVSLVWSLYKEKSMMFHVANWILHSFSSSK